MKHFTKQNNFLYSLTEKLGIQMNSTVYTLKRTINYFPLKYILHQNKVHHLMLIFFGIFLQCLIEYSLIKIVEFEFTLKIKI